MKILYYDAVVIGSGCAGYNCADYLKDFGVKKVAIVTEGKDMGTSRNTGSDKQTYYKLSLAGTDGDSVEQMAQTLFSGGAMDGDVAVAEAANSVRSFIKLVQLGVNFPTNEYGEFVAYKTDHDPCSRATSIGPYTSQKMTEVLERSALSKGVELLDGLQAVKILTDENRAVGLVALDLATGEFTAIRANAVVMATGGPASIYYDSVYPLGHTGNSSLALNAGAELRNLCEWQYGLASVGYRWNVSGTYQQVLPRYISVDENGVEYEFLSEYLSDEEQLKRIFLKGYEWPFDCRKAQASSYIDLLVYRQTAVLNRKVYMDFTREPSCLTDLNAIPAVAREYLEQSEALVPLPVNRLRKMNPGAIELYLAHGIDLEREPLEIAVCAQHNNGGVSVDSSWQSTVDGLYVIGEAAGTLGIFRPGGSALNSCQVGGLQAAKHIAYRLTPHDCLQFEDIAQAARQELAAFAQGALGSNSTILRMRERYQRRMSKYFAFNREIGKMKKALEEIVRDKERFCADNQCSNASEWSLLFKNYDIVCTAEAVAGSMLYAAERFGSRGGAMVTDEQGNPVPENEEGRKKIVAIQQGGSPYEKDVKPLPARNLWFEKVWGEFRAITEKKH